MAAAPSFAADIKPFTREKCETCHSPSRTVAERAGAPQDLNYDTYAKMSASADTAAREVEADEMPPTNLGGEALTADEKDKFLQWVYCGKAP